MRHILLFALFAVLTACASPQVTVTLTPPPTPVPTVIPTQTPEPISQAFIDLQQQIAQSDHYTLNAKGELEMENPDKTISIVENIGDLDKDGKLSITDDDEEMDAASFSIDGYSIKLVAEDGRIWILDGNRLINLYSNEDTYYKSLAEKQKELFDQTKDMRAEGFTRQFLTENGFTNYIAYHDSNGEVAYIWNFEQDKLNPALKIENNLLINETSGSHIIWNPNLDKEEAQQTLADYFTYVRARVIAGATGVNLGGTLESALANPLTQEFLDEGRNVTLLPTSRNYTNIDGSSARFSVPAQNIFISGETPIVFRTVSEMDKNMVVIHGIRDGQRFVRAYSFEQNSEGILFLNYFSGGSENLPTDYILARRLAFGLSLMFTRTERTQVLNGDIDNVTASIIFNGSGLLPKNSLVIYSQTR